MTIAGDAPNVFISYSWKPQINKNKVLELAQRLQLDHVHVIIDEWNLTEGQDKYKFMEQMVNQPEVKRVLLICNKEYAEKANQKKGGVGIESLIVSDEIYTQVDQKKFIPIVFERAENGTEYLPTFIKSRIYIDLSSDDNYEAEYEKLLRNIFEKPSTRRPPLGAIPTYLMDEPETTLRTAHKVNAIKTAFINEKKNVNVLINDYYSTFLDSLNDFRFEGEDFKIQEFMDDKIFRKIEELRPLRNDFIQFTDTICTFSETVDAEKLHDFWGRLIEFIVEDDSYRLPESNENGYLIMDHFKFLIRELFLYQITQLLERKKFETVQYLLYNPYVIFSSRIGTVKPYNYEVIRQALRSFSLRNERLALRKISLIANLMKERTSDSKISFEKLNETDILLYYISIMNDAAFRTYREWYWFPELAVFWTTNLPFLERMISKRFFEKIKGLFAINDVTDLYNKLSAAVEIDRKINRYEFKIPLIEKAFSLEKIATIP